MRLFKKIFFKTHRKSDRGAVTPSSPSSTPESPKREKKRSASRRRRPKSTPVGQRHRTNSQRQRPRRRPEQSLQNPPLAAIPKNSRSGMTPPLPSGPTPKLIRSLEDRAIQRKRRSRRDPLRSDRRPQRLESVARRSGTSFPQEQPELRELSPPSKLLVYTFRLLIVGIGLGAIAGTFLSAVEKTHGPLSAEANSTQEESSPDPEVTPGVPPSILLLKQESAELKTLAQKTIAQYPQLQPGVVFVDLDTGVYLNLDGMTVFPAASTIKLPILIAFFQDVDAGRITLDEMLTMEEEDIAPEAGMMQYKKPGTQFSALETVTQMITISDNTATNMIIERLGGTEALNKRFRSWNLPSTALHSPLPDLEGTNTTSPMDLVKLMAMVDRGELVSVRSRDRLLDILRNVVTNDLLPRGLDQDAIIAHKTGNIGSLIADAGLIDTPTGKRYLAVVMVKRPRNDAAAKKLIREISRAAYQYFNRPVTVPEVTTTPATSRSLATEAQD